MRRIQRFNALLLVILSLLSCKKDSENPSITPLPTTYEIATYVFSCLNQDKKQIVLVVDMLTEKQGATKKGVATIAKMLFFETQSNSEISTTINSCFFELESRKKNATSSNLASGIFYEKLKKLGSYREIRDISTNQLLALVRGEETTITYQNTPQNSIFDLFAIFSTPAYAQQNKVEKAILSFMFGLAYIPSCSLRLPSNVVGVADFLLDIYGKSPNPIPSTCGTAMELVRNGTKALWEDIIAASFIDALNPNSEKGSNEVASALTGQNNGQTSDAATASGGAWGDPHFTTLDGSYYDFQGVGEFMAAKSTTDKLELQVRQQEYGTSKMVSVNTALAFNTGSDVVAVYLSPRKIMINKRDVGLTFTDIALSNGGKVTRNGDALEIRNNTGDILKVSFTPDFLNYVLMANQNRRSKMSGLLGNFDGNKLNDITTRGGLTVNPTDFKAFHTTFSDSWRITQTESLFDYENGTTTATYTNKNFPQAEYNITQNAYQQAFKTCTDAGISTEPALSSCIYDVALTGRANWASYYLDIQKTFRSAGLIAYYPFNGNANDESGNNNHGEVFGEASLTADRNSKPNRAYSFNGRNQFIRVSNSRLLHGMGQEITLSAWVLWKKNSEASILCKASSSEQQLQFFFYRTPSTKETFFHTNGGNVGASKFLLDMDRWYHVAMIIDGTTRRFYVNGDFVGTVTGYPLIKPNFSPLEIGRDFFGATELHEGFLDDIRIYNKVLSDQEVKELSKLEN